ncbi:uncharacterized protein J4E92_007913 [Alternaria infectoria]|uniref:uncharacterized protein n=1 Tax=Alternaria infectoria TaxID=45303 RepID=UPI00221EA26E|nr:uncharacterized protein J4E92_007913 [Alternaria infectoria]KAI4923159.1 hypothetical protein J4E92_007913 [Alternaria infectoria]
MPTVLQTAGDMVDNLGNKIHYTTRRVGDQIETTTNQVLPPKQREHMLERARDYAHQNPKVAAFLTTQTALTGLPLALFLAFATTTLLVSLSTCLFLGLLISIAITFFLVGFALLFVVPTVIIASCSATFIFIWGFVGYIILRRFNEGEELQRGTPVGDKLYKLTGGRSGYLQSDQTSSESSSDRRRLGGGNAANGSNGGVGHAHGGVSSHARDGGPVNGVNGTQGAVEWERKWADGVQPKPVVLETDNVFEVLKAVSKLPVLR